MNKAIGFIGLGVMGFPMAGHLSNSGFDVHVFNRSNEKSLKWSKRYNGKVCNSLKEISEKSEVIILCLRNDEDVKKVICSKDGIINNFNNGSLIIDHTTTCAELSIELSSLVSEHGIEFLDAPVSGGEVGAQSGQLSIMVGGKRNAYEKAKNILNPYTKHIKYMGESGSGQLTKMVNQICIAGLIQALAEAINFSNEVGLNSKEVLEVVSKGAAQSWQMDNRWQSMLDGEYNHGFAVDLMIKDLNIVLDKADKLDIDLEVTKVINNFYSDIQKVGGGKLDTSSLLKRIVEPIK
tara:strand:+ start:17937 stop:18815 length:879 start_codon:yes stop_codon:yes gene_type:complete